MTIGVGRRALLQAGAAIIGGAAMPTKILADSLAEADGKPAYEFLVKDIVYRRDGDKARLARLYQPRGNGLFPAVLQVHGGAWNYKDRTDGQNTALDLAAAGWLKAHAREFGSSPERVGVVLSIDFRNAPEAP